MSHSMPRSVSVPAPPKPARRSSVMAEEADPADALGQSGKGAPAAGRTSDAFGDWKASVSDVNKMTLTQIRMRDFDGLKHLHKEIKSEGAVFKQVWLKTLDDDQLFDNRTLFCDHGVLATKKQERRMDVFKKKNWKPSESAIKQKEAKDALFTYYGLDPSAPSKEKKSKNIDNEFFALASMFRGQIERSPEEQERRFQEDRKNKAAEEDQRQNQQAAQRQSLKESMGGLGFGSNVRENTQEGL